MIAWLTNNAPFPSLDRALDEPNGLLAAGGDLGAERLVAAYRRGIFPWYSRGQPILWWCPDPRAVLFPNEVRVSRSLAKSIRNRGYVTRLNTAFRDVIWNAPFYQKLGFRVMDDAQAGERLRQVLRREVEHGMPASRRCAMRLMLTGV